MTNMEHHQLRTICKELATQPSRSRRAQLAARLRKVVAEEEEKAFTPASSAMLRIAGQVFHFLEEFQGAGLPETDRKQAHRIRNAARVAGSTSQLGLASANLAD